MKEKYLNKIKQEFYNSYKSLMFDIDMKDTAVKRAMSEIKFPFKNKAVGGDDRLQMQLTKQRAENLASQKLDFNILKYLDNEISNNEIDFLFYFQNALNLNSGIDTELKRDINLKISEVEKSIGLDKLRIESNAVEILKNQLENYKQQTESNDPALKFENAYYENDLNNLSSLAEEI
ncbi:MAG TPA: hypothetical protein PKA90_14155 [Ignavibacteria bacterium]|nr:hypothetical protein [Ignavibacteria bacterium]HMR41562.1 hypothetical protein [Ignavibacteria bacterium]